LGKIEVAVCVVAMALTVPVKAGADEPLMWKRAEPGAHAYLGDDGGGLDTVTVCDTADRYRDWLNGEHAPGCQTFQHDLPTVIEVVVFDPTKDFVDMGKGGVFMPLVKVHIPSKQFIGYLNLEELHPVIPNGATIKIKPFGNGPLKLHSSGRIRESPNKTTEIGESATVKILSYDPTSGDNFDLHVSVLDGPHAGEGGWMLAWDVEGEDGVHIDQFDKGITEYPPRQ
jgi:hypothetical protein